MKVLVFGKTGQVARALIEAGPTVGMQITALGRDAADLTNPAACAAIIAASDCDAVINAAAYTAVDAAETDEATARMINADAPAAMAQACAAKGIPFVHVSTDYVFDGTEGKPWQPDDPAGPLGAYGRTKLAGEEGVAAAGGTFAILRTAWVFDAAGKNFVTTMLRLSETRDALCVVGDQFGGPTPATAIADACLLIAKTLAKDPSASGTYHFSGAPDVSWADFARAIFNIAGRDVKITDIPTADYPTPAKRPSNSRLDCSSTKSTFGITQPDWHTALAKMLTQA
ncbi:dTDP-4-dehydrorhamnose reductase [Yoonia algicola]|uniref:dTDP-4-dehydrorhamnose reductase n=1 Tax=Yoonia algicola TaxID=3137368 RepID=A0AAN0M688_9RHOB